MLLHYDAIIIGAGPAGATAANLLARAGWSVALVEKQSYPRRKVCGECLAATNLPLLDALGLGEAFEAHAGPALNQVAFMQGGETISADLPVFEHAKYPHARALGRETLDVLLLNAARVAGAVILQPWSVRAVGGTDGDLWCDIRALNTEGEARLRAPLVIAAHGSWESAAWACEEPDRRRAPGDLLAFKANFTGSSLAPGLLPVLSFSGGYGGMVVADGGRVTLACCVRADRLKRVRRLAPGLTAGAAVGAMLRQECAGVEAVFGNARLEGPWLAAGPLRPGMHFRPDDTVFRIGNAAGEAHPIIGEGMSMAMQSAWMLCGHLVRARTENRGLKDAATQQQIRKAYIAAWRCAFAPRLRLAASFAHLAAHPFLCAAPRSLIKHFPPLLKRAAMWSGKVRVVLDPALIAQLAAGRPDRAGDAVKRAC